MEPSYPEALEAIFPDLRSQVVAGVSQSRAAQSSDGEAFFDAYEREEEQRGDPGRQLA